MSETRKPSKLWRRGFGMKYLDVSGIDLYISMRPK